MISPLTKDDISHLPLNDLIVRMDSIFRFYAEERYGRDWINISHYFDHRPTVTKVISSKHVQQMPEEKQRMVCHLTFNCLLQMEYTEFTAGATNHYVYGSGYNEKHSWSSPSLQIRNAALIQFGIVSSRIAMECFMELVHYLGTGQRINSKKSTFKAFRKWLQNTENPFSYFATHILRAFHFDREHRTPEVHASSQLSGAVLCMKPPSSEEQNSNMELMNIMLNIWGPLLEILDTGKAHSMYGSAEDFEWLKSYLQDDQETKGGKLRQIFEQMK